MKKLVVLLSAVLLVFSASAQKRGYGGYHGGYYYRPGISVGLGFGFNPFGYPYYGYPVYNSYAARPSKLTMKIEDIKSDYADKIYSARHDTSLSHKQRRQIVRDLKHQRDEAIDNLKMNYYKN